ncbi:MAG: enhanced serine sensitivity protein SseB [Oscillospiraceae bacterium]|jgi:hypothetical protein|nr:enhanced serine sensitivity protein SseB [Oscillospiraceae bacterium]
MDQTYKPFDNWDAELQAMRDGGEPEQRAFFTKLRASKFFVPVSPLEGKGISLLSTPCGELFIPAFTTSVELQKWERREDGIAVRTFETLHHIVTDDPKLTGIAVNPFGDQLVLYRRDLAIAEDAATGMTHERVEHTGRLIATAAKYAPALARAFSDALKNSGIECFEAYILQTRQEHEPEPHLTFLIDFNGDRKLLFPAVAKAIQPHMKAGTSFELLKATFATLQIARDAAAPVYTAH